MIKGILIDFGGTIDSDGVHWFNAFERAYSISNSIPADLLRDAYVHAERTLGRNPIIGPDYTFLKTLQTKIEIQESYLQAHGVKVNSPENVMYSCYNKVVSHMETVSRPVLEKLAQSVPLVLVSNFYGNMHTVLDEFGLSHLFSHVVESSVVGVRKPDPQIFRLGVEKLGLEPSRTVMIGDSPDKDIIPAQSIGCHTVWLRNSTWSDQECTPDSIISSLAQLPGVLDL